MVHGTPDWQQLSSIVETIPRPSGIFPSGVVLLYEDFEATNLHWGSGGAGGGNNSLTNTYVFAGEQSLAIKTGAVAGSWWAVSRSIGHSTGTKFGFEAKFAGQSSLSSEVRFTFASVLGGVVQDGGVRFDPVNEKWQYADNSVGWTDVPNGAQRLERGSTCYHHIKFIVDLSKLEYVYFQCNNQVFDIKGIKFREAVSGNRERILFTIRNSNSGASAQTVFIDDVVITAET